MLKSPKVPSPFYIFDTMRQFQSSHFLSEITFFHNVSTNNFLKLLKFLRYVRILLRFTKAEKNEVRKQAIPFLPAQKAPFGCFDTFT